jgi:hypothetical protein
MSGQRFDGLYDSSTVSGVYGREAATDQTYTSGQITGYAVFATTSNNVGYVPITTTNNYFFQSVADYTTAFLVTYNITWTAQASNSGVKQTWISKNNSQTDRYGFTSFEQAVNHNQSSANSAIVVLAPGDYIGIRVFQNTGADQSIDGTSNQKCKLQITEINLV